MKSAANWICSNLNSPKVKYRDTVKMRKIKGAAMENALLRKRSDLQVKFIAKHHFAKHKQAAQNSWV